MLTASIALAEDLTTVNGKEYKNATVSRVEPDGIVLKSKSGISKVYFTELPKEVQEHFHYDREKATAYTAEQNANLKALRKQEAGQRGFAISPAESDGLRIEHESYGKLLSEAHTKATNLNYNEDRANALISSIPAGGRLVLNIERSTIGAANTKYFTVIVFDRTGKEIVRGVGSKSTAEIPGSNGKWWNIMTVELPEISETPIKIRVVDALSNKASEFNAE